MFRIILVLFVCLSAFQLSAEGSKIDIFGDDAYLMYDALTIPEVDQSQDVHQFSSLEKRMDGLVCTFWMSNINQFDCGYGCSFDADLNNSKKGSIYEKINKPEQLIESERVKTYTKILGSLTFRKIFYILNEEERLTEYEFSVLAK